MTDETTTAEPTPADVAAIAQAGGSAAAQAPEGATKDEIREIVREAVKAEADERNLRGFSDDDAKQIATITIAQLEARGAFETPEPTPAGTPAGTPEPTPAPTPEPEEAPAKRTFAERFLRG